jgi:hypothetical protein
MLRIRCWRARRSSTSGFLLADCTALRRPYGRVSLATPALVPSFVLAKVKWLLLRYEARQFRRKQHRKLATGRSCMRSANRLGHSYVRAVRFSGWYSTIVRLPGGSAGGIRTTLSVSRHIAANTLFARAARSAPSTLADKSSSLAPPRPSVHVAPILPNRPGGQKHP